MYTIRFSLSFCNFLRLLASVSNLIRSQILCAKQCNVSKNQRKLVWILHWNYFFIRFNQQLRHIKNVFLNSVFVNKHIKTVGNYFCQTQMQNYFWKHFQLSTSERQSFPFVHCHWLTRQPIAALRAGKQFSFLTSLHKRR